MILAQDVAAHARALGFDLVGIMPTGSPERIGAFEAWLAAGHHGEMAYLARRTCMRADPAQLSPGARTIIAVGVSYHPGASPAIWRDRCYGRFARYAWGGDYHGAIKPALYELDAFIRQHSGRTAPGKACVDTAPLLERDFAAQAGLGFIGRNTCLITPGLGSWTLLGALLVPEPLGLLSATDSGTALPALRSASSAACGRCTRCLDACPTGAFVAPYVLDARRCISYLTIELRGPIPQELRPRLGNWVFGCDLCQEVCPYNRAAPFMVWPALQPDLTKATMPLLELLSLGEDGFRARFRGAAVLRTRRRGLVRNACVAAGNWGDRTLAPILAQLLEDPEPLVRGHAAWALGRVGGIEIDRALSRAAAIETDSWVIDEILAALGG
jgi:epoxyqueuosine reductase